MKDGEIDHSEKVQYTGIEADEQLAKPREEGFEIFCLPPYEDTRENVVYAKKATSRF